VRPNTLPRKLAAILYADVAAYSRLTGKDEEGTHRQLSRYLDLISSKVEACQGRVVHYAGDAVLADFASVTTAVDCAVDIQEELADRNSLIPDDRKVQFRMGINLGDVIVDRDDIYGDGVNIAARLESLARPGGICVSGSVYEQVRKRTDLAFEDMGEHSVKNIEAPVHIYAIKTAKIATPEISPQKLSDRPAIAVLPFENRSADPEQEYFADGITEDVITALSYWRWFPVIAHNSTQAYKGKTGDATTIGEELGARYLVQGSVRRSGDAVRVSVHLIDARNGHEVWAERYDRRMEDVFALQDEITERIVAGVEPRLHRAEENRAVLKRPNDLTAWDHIMRAARAKAMSGRGYGTKEANNEARQHLERARELEPTSAETLARLAECEWHDAITGWAEDRKAALSLTVEYARAAVDHDDGNWLAHSMLGIALLFGLNETVAGVRELEMSVSLNPSASSARHGLGCGLGFAGKPTEALPHLNMVFKLDPQYRNSAAALGDLGLSNFLLGNYDESIDYLTEAATTQPDYVRSRQRLVASLAAAGRTDEAREELAALRKIQPTLSLEYINTTYPFEKDGDRERFVGALRSVGLE
jgi:TolB-like protein/class 3 adenylate cyclase